MNVVDEHIAALLLEWIKQHGGAHKSTFTPRSAAVALKTQMAVNISEARAARVLDDLADLGLASKSHSPLTSGFYELSRDKGIQLFGAPGWTDAAGEKVERNTLVDTEFPVLDAYLKSDPSWSGHTVAELQRDQELLDDGFANLDGIPASDRVVRLDHNQISAAEKPVTELIDALENDNGNPDEPGLRERLLGQIRAARELLRTGEYRAYLMYELLVRSLGEIVKKYGNPTIVALANALLGAVVSQLIEAN